MLQDGFQMICIFLEIPRFLVPWLLVPFKEGGRQRLTLAQKRYNKAHSSARMAVERAFGKLKARRRILKNNGYQNSRRYSRYLLYSP